GEMRLVHFVPVALEDVAVSLVRSTEVGGVEVAGRVEHFAVTQGDGGTSAPSYAQAHPAGDVLAQVEQGLARRGLEDGHRLHDLGATHWLRYRSHECCRRGLGERDRLQVAVVVGSGRPAGTFQSRVVRLAAIDVGGADRAGGRLPRTIGRDGHGATIGVVDLQLHQQCDGSAVVVLATVEAEVATIPTVAEDDADGVPAGDKIAGDVVGLVLQTRVIAGPAWREQVVADAVAVEMQLVQTPARDVNPRRENPSLHIEAATEHRRGRAGRVVGGSRWTDPLRRPVAAVEEPGVPEDVATGVEVVRIGGDLNLVCRLDRVALAALESPAEARVDGVGADGIG